MRSLRWMFIVLFPVFMSGCLDPGSDVDVDAKMNEDLATIDQYLATNGIDAIVDKSGIRFHIDKLGTGFPPRTDQAVKVAYEGRLLNGTVFDHSADATGDVNRFIAGWQFLLTIWPAGTEGTVFIPSPLAYGDQPVGSIPANSILVFDITLKQVVIANAEKARIAADTVAIDKYLSENAIDAVKDSTGVRYVITNPGTGPLPTWYTKVKFTYTGKVIPGGSQVFNGSSQPTETFDSRVVDFLNGMKVGLTKIGAGGKITLYVPSDLAYGPAVNTQSPVLPNSKIALDIELLEVY